MIRRWQLGLAGKRHTNARQEAFKLFLFLVIGGLQFAFDAGAFVALTWVGVMPSFANVLARLFAACVGFTLNGKLTFNQRSLTKTQFIRYAICWGLLTITSTVLVVAAATMAGLKWAWLTKVLVEVVLAAVSFVLMRGWVFAEPSDGRRRLGARRRLAD